MYWIKMYWSEYRFQSPKNHDKCSSAQKKKQKKKQYSEIESFFHRNVSSQKFHKLQILVYWKPTAIKKINN